MSFALTQREVRALERKKMVLKRDVGGAMFKKEGGVCKLVVLFKCGPSLTRPSFLILKSYRVCSLWFHIYALKHLIKITMKTLISRVSCFSAGLEQGLHAIVFQDKRLLQR